MRPNALPYVSPGQRLDSPAGAKLVPTGFPAVVDKGLESQLEDKGNYPSDNSIYLYWMNPPTFRSTWSKAAMPGAMDYLTGNCTNPILRGSVACAADDPDGDLAYEALDQLIAEAKAQALSANTRKTHRTGWTSRASWAGARESRLWPRGPSTSRDGWPPCGGRERSPIPWAPTSPRWPASSTPHPGPNPARHHDVSPLLSGLRRRADDDGNSPLQASPLPWAHIRRIADAARMPRPNQLGGRLETSEQAHRRAICDIAMTAVAHDAAPRCSELLAIRWADINPPQHGGCWTVRIRRSKTDQPGRGAYAPISEFTAQAIANVKPAHARPDDRIFNISPSTVTRRLKAASRAPSIDLTNITSHSPRVGMAQDLAAWGINLPGLMLAGRWKTAAMPHHYTQHLDAQNTPAAQYLKIQDQPCPKTAVGTTAKVAPNERRSALWRVFPGQSPEGYCQWLSVCLQP